MNNLLQIDFNDTICFQGDGDNRVTDWFDGVPMPGALGTITQLWAVGYKLEILTSRTEADWPRIKEWLRKYKFPEMVVSNIKKPALAYIDNRAIRFINWADIAFTYL